MNILTYEFDDAEQIMTSAAAPSIENANESILVRCAQAGDPAAFRTIVERYRSKVLSTVRTILNRNNDSEDVAQQVFVNIHFGIRAFDSRGSLWAWIYRITVNECYDYLRKKKARPLVYESDFAPAEENSRGLLDRRAPHTPADTRAANRELATWLLQQVSEQERFLLLMKEVEGCTVAELSSMTGLGQDCIKIKLFRARKKMLRASQRAASALRRNQPLPALRPYPA